MTEEKKNESIENESTEDKAVENEIVLGNNVSISDDVFTLIASIATKKVEGVYGTHSGVMSSIFSRNSYSKGVKVEKKNDILVIDIYIDIKYGYNVTKVAKAVQESVKTEIEVMTEFNIEAVNVHVEDIITEKKEKEKEKEAKKVDDADVEVIEEDNNIN